jgi:peptidyl-dipeptidase A
VPFPDVAQMDINAELKAQNYDAYRMHRLGEDFYKSLGYDALPDSFWTKSMITKPNDREVVCHASAWDLNKNDLRIKMCTAVSGQDLQTIHHEQGHLYYDHSYRHQPKLFREGAADFFHEAIGDTIVLSFLVPEHLKEVGLLKKVDVSYEQTINAQLSVALSKIPNLPWTYLLDYYRWNVFEGKITKSEYQSGFLKMIEKFQGMKRMVDSDADDFDAGAKYHVASNTPYIRYFGAAILQFQFYESMCEAKGHKGSLHTCSFYKSKEAGDLFKNMLEMGKSDDWFEAVKVGTNGKSNSLDASSMMKYFEPLMEYLKKENQGHMCGWLDRRRIF